MVVYRCSVCNQWSDFTTYFDEEVIDEGGTQMPHVHIPTLFHKCGHKGYFRWTKKEFIQLCQMYGIKHKIRPIKPKELKTLMGGAK